MEDEASYIFLGRHFVACHELEQALDCEGDSIQAFYGRLGVVLLGTVMDGD